MIFDLAECEEIVGYSFRDKQLLRTAFTHTSYANEHNAKSYERMEYLGDALLDFIVAEYLFKKYPGVGEGELTTRRAKLVSKTPLKEIAEELKLGQYVLLGEGGEKSGERQNDKILSSLIESALAAVYLDGGMDPARRFVEERILCHADRILRSTEDYKTELQEYVQKNRLGALSYGEAGRSGPDHSPVFASVVRVAGKEIATGKGGNKRQAEQDAARSALAYFRKDGTETAAEAPVASSRVGGGSQKVRRKEKKPRETRVLSLVADYGEKKKQEPQKKGGKGSSGASEKAKKAKDVKNGAKKPHSDASAPKKQAKEEKKQTKKVEAPVKKEQKEKKPTDAKKTDAKKNEAKKKNERKKPFFGFVGNAKMGGDGTPLS